MQDDGSKNNAANKDDARKARLASALRDNLRRRKNQGRLRQADEESPDSDPSKDSSPDKS
jgi:hypothetical protein